MVQLCVIHYICPFHVKFANSSIVNWLIRFLIDGLDNEKKWLIIFCFIIQTNSENDNGNRVLYPVVLNQL